MRYATIAIGHQVVAISVDDYGRVTITDQHPMTETEEQDAADAGHHFNMGPTIIERRNYPSKPTVEASADRVQYDAVVCSFGDELMGKKPRTF